MSAEAIISALIGAAAGVGFPAAVAWRLLSILEKKFDQRMQSVEKRLTQIAVLLAASAPPACAAIVEDLTGGNGLTHGKGAA